MVARSMRSSSATDDHALNLRPISLPMHLGISGIVAEFRNEPLKAREGAKRDSQITSMLGGCGRNGALVAVANNIPCGVLGPQASGHWAGFCSDMAIAEGLHPFVIERTGVLPSIAIAWPNGSPGTFDLDVQRMAPLTVKELMFVVGTAITLPRSVFVAPVQLDEDSEKFHRAVSTVAPQRALMVHPSLLRHPMLFGDIGRHYGFVQMNKAEASILDPTTDETAVLACRVRYLLGDAVDFAITNGCNRGLAWIDQNWHPIEPCEVPDVVCDIGAGDVWGSALVLARWYFGVSPRAALAYASRVAAAWVSGCSIPHY